MDERVWGDLVYGVVHDMVERACEVSCLLRGSVVFRSFLLFLILISLCIFSSFLPLQSINQSGRSLSVVVAVVVIARGVSV